MRFFGKSDRTPKMRPSRNFVIALLIGIFGAILDPTAVVAQIDGGGPGSLPGQSTRAAGTGGASAPAPGPQSVLETAINRLESCESISAKVRQRVELFGKPLVGSGSYLEQRTAQSLMFRLELRFQFKEKAATLLQACDGRHLWIYEDFRDNPTVAEVDVGRIVQRLEETGVCNRWGKWVIGQVWEDCRNCFGASPWPSISPPPKRPKRRTGSP